VAEVIDMRVISNLVLIFVIALSLVACGGNKSDNEKVVSPENTNVEPPVVEPAKPDANGKLAATIEMELTVEGKVETRTGTLAVSENGYYLYTLPQFKFTPEEPNMDQVYMDKFEDFNMRIQTLGAEPDLAEIRANANEELAMLGDVVEMKGEQIGEPALRDSIFYLHSSDSTLNKSIILRKIDGMYFKIIVNMPNGEAQVGAGPSFPAMIKTIEPTRP
jgi:hypothetical protein